MSTPFVLTPSKATEKSVSSLSSEHQQKPLHNLKLAVKDLFHMKGLPTAAGNPDWLATHALPNETNSTVRVLLDAGAEFKGKTITDELAYSLHGQNKHYDVLINPAAPAHIPGGSSSGSAVAVSAHLADIGLGTDTGGSIRVPASYQGLWGLRTTHGLVPCDNMVPLAPSFDTIGWMTRDLDTLIAVSNEVIVHKQQTVQSKSLDDTHFGIATALFSSVAHSKSCLAWLEELEKVSPCKALSNRELDLAELQTAATFRTLQGSEIWQQHGDWITSHQPDIADDIMLRLNWCSTITQDEALQAKEQQDVVIKHLNGLFSTIDVLVIPTTPGIAPRCDADDATLANDRNALLALTAIAGLAGLPQLHMPLFTLHNAPCGLSLVGKKGSDLALLSLAKAIQATTAKHKK